MEYQFYNLIANEPDLEDLKEYLKSPLLILKDLGERFEQLKNEPHLNEMRETYNSLINRHFPELIKNYCNLSVHYRNTEIIKEEKSKNSSIKYTAKDLLLKNTKKLIQEINGLNIQFHEQSKNSFLVRNKIISQLGNNNNNIIQLSMDKKSEPLPQQELKNQFNFEAFKNERVEQILEKEIENKETVAFENVLVEINTIEEKQIKTKKFSPEVRALILAIPLTFFTLIMLSLGNNIVNKEKSLIQLISVMKNNIKSSHIGKDYADVNTQYVLDKSIVPVEMLSNDKKAILYNSYTASEPYEVEIEPNRINKNNDSFKIVINNLSISACEELTTSSSNTENVRINGQYFDKNEHPNLHKVCAHTSNKISIIAQ